MYNLEKLSPTKDDDKPFRVKYYITIQPSSKHYPFLGGFVNDM